MTEPEQVANTLERVFTTILNEQMRGIPILNHAIKIQAVGFRAYEGRILGILITPWVMNVVLLPGENEDWSGFELGKKQPQNFPGGTYKFMINEIDEIGTCQTHSLYSPMHEFTSHAQAVSAAGNFLEKLMSDRHPDEEEPVNEELLGQIMRGEVVPETNFPDFSTLSERVDDTDSESRPETDTATAAAGGISRRNLLRGKLQSNS